MKPLDQKQLRVWDQYLDWQVAENDHQRTVVLFERCLIPCALYEQFWAKYARYLERAHKEGRDRMESSVEMEEPSQGDISKARNAFQTGLATVDQLRESRCTWTLRGWRETLKNGTQVGGHFILTIFIYIFVFILKKSLIQREGLADIFF